MMKNALLAALVSLSMLTAGCASHATAAITTRAVFPLLDPGSALHRGVNLGNMLEAPNEGDWGLSVHQEYFPLIRQAGFDFVRVPIRWSAHADVSAPYAIDPAFLSRIDQVVGWALQNQLAIILDFHNYGEIMTDPQANRERFLGIWEQVAVHYQKAPPQVLFELLNEPNDWLNAATWNLYAHQALDVIRASNPTRLVIIDSPENAYYGWINTLDVPQDMHVMVTFHYYEPFHFTHQGATWVGTDTSSWLGTTWQGTDAERAAIEQNFDQVATWARQQHVRILLGEFGAYSKGDLASRVRWTAFVARTAERYGFPWAYWELASGFGIYDPEAGAWRPDLLRALIPDAPVPASP